MLRERALVRGSSIDFDLAIADALHGAHVLAPTPDDHPCRAERDLDLDLRVRTGRQLFVLRPDYARARLMSHTVSILG